MIARLSDPVSSRSMLWLSVETAGELSRKRGVALRERLSTGRLCQQTDSGRLRRGPCRIDSGPRFLGYHTYYATHAEYLKRFNPVIQLTTGWLALWAWRACTVPSTTWSQFATRA
jgi:hypothetical protein